MLLPVFTRHSNGCRFPRDRTCRRFNCPTWVGRPGQRILLSPVRQNPTVGQWAEAEEVLLKVEEALIKGLPPFAPRWRRFGASNPYSGVSSTDFPGGSS